MKYENSYLNLDTRLFHRQPPTPLDNPRAGHFNPIVAEQLGWTDDDYLMTNWVDIIGGKVVPEGFAPLAMVYAGHQFGQWAGQLGDGRGLLMAQVQDKNNVLTDLHLKGIGLTPYSRMGDGRAVLRSTIREYLCGHAMTQLGIASSNALGFVTSDTLVQREKFEAGAALMRVSDCHIRLGHIEWIASFAPDLLSSFTDYMIDTYYPHCRNLVSPVLSFLSQVVKRTAVMIANWQLVGFAHGVMNTDNLSITGSTIDYGPFGFLERFNPAWINNHSDHTGRYSYQNQPAIGHWNLNMWLSHFLRLDSVTRSGLEACLADYEPTFSTRYQQGICQKLGLRYHNEPTASTSQTIEHKSSNQAALSLAYEFLAILEENRLDYTNSFRALSAVIVDVNTENNMTVFDQTAYTHDRRLLDVLESELVSTQHTVWSSWKSRYTEHLKADYGSAEDTQQYDWWVQPLELLNTHNPVYVLRNSMAQRAIDAAINDDFSEVDRLFKLLTTPFEFDTHASARLEDTLPPAPDAPDLVISCSS